MRTYSTAFKRLIAHTLHSPGSIPRQEIDDVVNAFYSNITNSDNPLALKELAEFFSIKLSLLKSIVLKHLELFKRYYRAAATDTKILIMRIDCKFRQDPEVFVALLMGVLKFAGYTDDFCRYRQVARNKKFAKIIWPKELDSAHKVLPKICAGPIDDYPEVIAFLAVNYLYNGKRCLGSNKMRLFTAIDLLVFELLTKKLPKEDTNEKFIQPGSKTDVL